jgi:acyl-homoserine-lactone acylase
MKTPYLFLFCLAFYTVLVGQIDPSKIDIVRDSYGVPHIFAATDAEVAYGLAYAHAEDDFNTIQISYLAGNNLLSKHMGNKGLGADFISQFIGSDKLFESNYEKDIHPDYKK